MDKVKETHGNTKYAKEYLACIEVAKIHFEIDEYLSDSTFVLSSDLIEYTHFLTLTAGSTNYVLMYDCATNLVVDSLEDLRTIMKVSSTSDNVILPVVNPTDLSTAGLQVTTSLCKIGNANVTAVTDKVTAL